MKERSLADRLDRLGGQLVADYGSYLLYEVPESTAEETIGLPEVETLDEYRFVLLNSGPVDTRRAASGGGRQIRESFDGKRLQIVQLVGPTRPEWLAALRDTGAEVVTYLPHNAYLVYADAASMGALAELQREERFVGWQAPYQREHKVHPRAIRSRQLRGLRKRTLQPSSVQEQDLYAVQLIDDPAANAVTVRMVRAISKGALRSQFRIRNYLNLIVPLDPGDVDAVAARPDVVSIHPFVPPERSGERQGQILASGLSGTNPGYLDFLAAMGFTQQQFTSSGFSVDISDSGIDNATTSPNHPGLYIGGNPAAASRVVYNRLEGSPLFGNTLEGCDGHGNINAHILAGYNDGSGFPFADAEGFRFGLGVAPFVRVGSSVIFAPDYTFPSFPDLQSRAYADGARISSNSWGGLVYGAYDVTAQAFDALVRDAQPSASAVASPGNQEMVIVIAAGNEGLEGLRSPGTSKNVISVGASENVHFLGDLDGCGVDDIASDHADDIAWFSSHGPTEDGRNKPDLVAPGTHVSGGVYQAADPGETGQAHPCFDGSANCGLATGFYFPPGQQFYTISSGTSHSTPAVAGSAALVRQLFINQGLTPPSPAMTKAFLMSSARYLTGEGANDSLWSNGQGMGAVDLGVAFDTTPRILRDQRPDDTFTASGETVVVTGTVAEPGNPFRVTLAWTDAPGSTTGPAFNNDLDLTVTVGGQIYKGNVFSGPFSITGGAADMRNNVESVFLPAGTVGDFTVSVAAININSDGVPNVGGPLDQD
ncbi:MAG TPA: S8 family serine peptidase, partial [Vicinamibacteria bacterium]|nr:S8 family serine peptidase [Vicinamibacteria bacterium]